MPKTLKELAELVNGDLHGDPDVCIQGAADIADAEEGDIVFAESPRFFEEAQRSRASAIIVRRGMHNSSKPTIAVDNPRYAFARVLEEFSPVKNREIGIHPTSVIGPGTIIGENPSIGYNVYIGRNTNIGKNVWIYPFAYIGDNVRIGDNCIIYPFVAIHDDVVIGNSVIVHSGTVIGSDGFGYTCVNGEHYKMPQIGKVVIGDNVEIGANVTIDRARTGKTVIGRGTKIDNLVQIAHNTEIGENCVIVAQVGISGSVKVGNGVILAGQTGLKDHISIGDGAVVCAKSGVIGDVGPGEVVSGYPARSHKDQMRILASQQKLPTLLKQVKELERRVGELEERLKK
jgi:UDP-3-O-[3-hydroxymyristoyl] glucosamine N-acyltransferase